MKPLSSESIRRILGSVDEQTAAAILATGATDDELLEAVAWVHADDAMMDNLRRMPAGRVGQLVEILQPTPPLEE
ncbi:MAG: hypothetical protein ACLFU0_09095 [Alphaproteobacteria bacterium]